LPNAAWPGRLHRKPLEAAIGQLLTPYRPSATRATINLTMMQHVLTLLAISMAIAMRRYYTMHIARWRRFVAFIKATKHPHRTSTTPVVSDISSWKRAPVDMLAPNNNRGMPYQTNKKH
jgi:hypothetical protein